MDKNHLDISRLDDECRLFCLYLINRLPSDYIIEKYQGGHRTGSIKIDWGHLDKLMINIARISPFFTKLVDSYTSIFFKDSVVRKKLVLLLAILESSATTHHYLDSVDQYGKGILYIRMFQKGVLFILIFSLSVFLLMPLHFVVRSVERLKVHG